nr:hypothetical protein [Glycomyces buryatensis]
MDRQLLGLAAEREPEGALVEAGNPVEGQVEAGRVFGCVGADLVVGEAASGARERVRGVSGDDGLLEPDGPVVVGRGGGRPQVVRVGAGGRKRERHPVHGRLDFGSEPVGVR